MNKKGIAFFIGFIITSMYTVSAIVSTIPSGLSSNQQIASSSLNNDAPGTNPDDLATYGGITTGLFVIEKTGYYFLANDVVANPSHSNNAIIYIDASNTILDLGGKTLSLSSTSNTSNIVGVRIAPGRTNITIFNGGIIGYSSLTAGDPVGGALAIGISADGNGNILLQDLLISECASLGIDISYTNDIKVKNVSTQSIGGVVSPLSPLCGAQFLECYGCFITDSVFDYTNSVSDDPNNVFGLRLNACGNVTISNVSTSNNQAFGSGSVYGLSLENSTGCRADAVYAVNNITQTDMILSQTTAGIILDGSTGNTFRNCTTNSQINNASNIFTSTTIGFLLTNSSNSNNFFNCVSSDNLGGALSAGFFLSDSSYNTFEKCVANGNNSPYPGASNITVYGFHSEFGVGNVFSTCEARGNFAYIDAVDSDTLISYGEGVTPEQVALQQVAGIDIRSEIGTSILFSTFSSNLGGLLGTVYGIRLYGECQGCTVSYNEMFSNRALKMYGFKDYAAHCTTLLRGNIAYGQGNIFGGGEGVISDSGAMNYMMSYAKSADQMSVQMVVKESDIANMNAFEAGSTKWYNFSILGKAISG